MKKKVNKYADLSAPQMVLDFHQLGPLTTDEICDMANKFLMEAKSNGFKRVLLVVGKGYHSKEGPVVGPLLRQYLPTLPLVRRVRTARVDRGGEGALEVEIV